MKKLITACFYSAALFITQAQNIDDNNASFGYIQLPMQKLNAAITSYEVRVIHTYKTANEDSSKVFQQRKETAEKNYKTQYDLWLTQKKNIDKQYYAQLAQYEKNVNAGVAATAPAAPLYPASPLFVPVEQPRLHTELTDTDVAASMDLKGFTKGLGGAILTIDILPIRDVRIIETKTGTGPSTKYEYKCQYVLPVDVSFDTPTDGNRLKKRFFEGLQYQTMKSYNSRWEYLVWLADNEQQFYKDLERDARKRAFAEINTTLNNEFGFVPMTRGTEIYSVKKYKDYDYSDVITAYTATSQAFALVYKDKNRAASFDKIDQAVLKWKTILQDSNPTDEKSRINDKVSAVIYCNLAELLVWRGDFDQAELYLNLALNSGVLKARNHAERVASFYADQRKRWQLHY
jgi:hypothetical protein